MRLTRVSGAAIYPYDVRLPNMLFGAILRCLTQCASQRLETAAAETMPASAP